MSQERLLFSNPAWRIAQADVRYSPDLAAAETSIVFLLRGRTNVNLDFFYLTSSDSDELRVRFQIPFRSQIGRKAGQPLRLLPIPNKLLSH
jgi:hypothetical protein